MKCYRKSESEIERERERVQEREKEENDENLGADLVWWLANGMHSRAMRRITMLSLIFSDHLYSPGLTVGDLELRTETSDEHIVVNDQLSDGGRRQCDRHANQTEQRWQLLLGHWIWELWSKMCHNLNHLLRKQHEPHELNPIHCQYTNWHINCWSLISEFILSCTNSVVNLSINILSDQSE